MAITYSQHTNRLGEDVTEAHVESLDELLSLYRPSDFGERGKDYKEAVIASHMEWLQNYGETLIPRFSNTLGVPVWLKTPQL